jgi:hypothetical protein
VIIGAGVTIGSGNQYSDTFYLNFKNFYNRNGKKAGTYYIKGQEGLLEAWWYER